MSASEHLNPQQFKSKALPKLSPSEQTYISRSSMVRGGFARKTTAEQLQNMRNFPVMPPRHEMEDLMDRLDRLSGREPAPPKPWRKRGLN